MNCQEALDLLYDIIDKEASEIDAQEVQQHLDGCRDCFKIYRLESSIQALIQERLKNNDQPANTEVLKSRVISKLDAIDREENPGAPPRVYSLVAKVMVAVAAVVIIIGAVSLGSDYYRHVSLYVPFEEAHHELAGQPLPDDPPVSTYLGLDFSDIGARTGYALVSYSKESINDVEMAHFVYSNGNSSVSVFAVPKDDYPIPLDLAENSVTRNGIVYFEHHCRTCHLLFHQVDGAVIITASEQEDIDLFPFSPQEKVSVISLLLP